MEPKCVVFTCATLFALLLLITGIRPQNFHDRETIDGNDQIGCAYLHCEGNDVCVHRKFRCKDPPCPSMLFCARSRAESVKGPSTCDNVQCTNGYVCMLKVRRCHWDEKCEQQIARCVSRKVYHEGPASCAGFKCPRGNHCILRESFCARPPCKLLRSCGKNKEVHLWFGRCRNLDCPSEYECFLRRPENNCTNPPCKHAPDCIITRENEVTNEHCRGWMCPRMQTCTAEIVGTCDANECNIKRSCHEVRVIAANDSSSFSRRSLKNKDEITAADIEVPKDSHQENELKETEMPHTWLDHLKSKTELDAIKLWIQNAEGQKDSKQFQDWLRSIKDILGSGAYSGWLEELLSSRSEEFRKWLRASQSKPDAEEPTFPVGDRSRTTSRNPYSVHRDTESEINVRDKTKEKLSDKMEVELEIKQTDCGINEHSTDDLSERMEEIGSLLREKNLTNILEKIFVPRNQFFPLQSPRIEDDQQFLVVPVKNMKELANSQIINYDPDVQDHREVIRENERTSGKQDNLSLNVSEEQRNLSSTKDELPSLWTGLQEDFEKKLPKKEVHSVEDSIGLSGDKRLMGREQHFDDIPVDLLEKFLKSMQFVPIESAPQTFDEKPIEGYREDDAPNVPRNEDHDRKFEWSSMDHSQDTEDVESGVGVLLDRSGNTRSLDHSDRSVDTRSELPLQQPDDADDDEMELNLFFEMNRESLLPYIQTLMDAVSEESNPLIQDTDPNSDESSAKSSPLNEGVTIGVNEEFSAESKSPKTEPSNIFVEALNDKSFRDPRISNKEKFDRIIPEDELPAIFSNSESNEGRESRTPEVIHANEEPTVPSFYNLPSYGVSSGDIVLRDYIYDQYNRTKHEDDARSIRSNRG